MQLTEEQKIILSSSGNLKIHAVAGSGKTTTLIKYAKKHGKKRRILYLAFNRSVKIEAQKRFAKEELAHVQVDTALLRRAIEYTNSSRAKRKIYFEGNLSSYMYAAEGASLWDVLNLYQGKFNLIKDPLIKQMKTMDGLQEYAEVSNDSELSTLIEMVNEHGRQLPSYINKIKEMHVEDKDRDKADMIFSTVHRSKGLEYDSVNLENDFISEKKLFRVSEKSEISRQDLQKLNEEINLLYVAITRSRGILKIPQGLFLDSALSTQPSQKKSSSHARRTAG